MLAALVTLLTGCGEAGPSSAPDSGVRGVVVSGPHCPVETTDNPCDDLPVADIVVTVTRADGGEAGRPRTDGEGRFELTLAAGAYVLQPVIENGEGMLAKEQQVTVAPGAFTEVTLLVDTGIR